MSFTPSTLVRPTLSRALAVLALFSLGGCSSIKHLASNQIADALASSGTTFGSDEDPELVKQAVPFSLKLMESVLSENPNHTGLLLASASGFTQYAYAFVQEDADELEATDYSGAETQRTRAKKLYLRARDYGLRGLGARHEGFAKALAENPRKAAGNATKEDVALLYWTAAAWGSAVSLGKDDPSLISQIPQLEALIDRALALDETWGDGALHSFLIQYELTRQGVAGDPTLRSKVHFERAVALSKGLQAGPFVAYAEAVCVEKQDLAQFEQLLQTALDVKVDAHPELRLANLVMQRRARWLLSRKGELFLGASKPSKS